MPPGVPFFSARGAAAAAAAAGAGAKASGKRTRASCISCALWKRAAGSLARASMTMAFKAAGMEGSMTAGATGSSLICSLKTTWLSGSSKGTFPVSIS